MESVLIGRSSCPACGYPVKYRWMGHGNEDLMVNPDGTPHKDSCPAANFREVRKRLMKMPRVFKAPPRPPEPEPPAPGESASSILERLITTPRAAKPTQPQEASSQSLPQASNETSSETSAPAVTTVTRRRQGRGRRSEPATVRRRPRVPKVAAKPEPVPPCAPAPSETDMPPEADTPVAPVEVASAPPAGRNVKARNRSREIERARCTECNVPLITNLNTGMQMCTACGKEAPAPLPTFPDEEFDQGLL